MLLLPTQDLFWKKCHQMDQQRASLLWGISSSGSSPTKGGGADDTLHRCPWSSDENPDIHCQFSGARHGTRSPGIKSLSTDSLLGNAIPPLVQVNWLSCFLPIVCGARISLSLLWAVCFCCACAGAGLLKDNQRAGSLVSLFSDYSSFHSFTVFLLN